MGTPMRTTWTLPAIFSLLLWVGAAPGALTGCTAEVSGTPSNAFNPGMGDDDDDVGGGDDDDDMGGSTEPPEDRTAAEVCAQWNRHHQERESQVSVGTDVSTCTAGTMTEAGLDDAFRRLNLFRWLNGLSSVRLDDSEGRLAAQQECALMMVANRALSHGPPPDWTCFTDTGRQAASSNLFIGGGSITAADSVDGFMFDGGANNAQVGHRRHFLNDQLASIGIGAAQGGGLSSSCFWVFDRDPANRSGRSFAAYPNPGVAPVSQVPAGIRWSVQSADFGRESADVRVVRLPDLTELSVRPDPGNIGAGGEPGFLAGGGFGDAAAYVWLPDGWEPTAGETYEVTIDREIGNDLVYRTTMVDCSQF